MTKMATIRTLLAAACAVLLCVLREVHGAEFIFGGEAKRVCKAYKLICPARKVCALQTIEYPRAMNFPVCVHERHVVVKSSICRKAPQPGKCGAQFRRWYFNVHMGSCSWFTYGGCGGNQNNFRTAEECERRCMSDEDRLEANRERRRDRERNSIIVEDDRTDDRIDENNVGNEEGEDREPTLITAPARAAEVIELDPDIKASLQLNGNQTDPIMDWKEERRRRRKERRRRRRQRNKRRRKNRRNETSYNPAGEETPVQKVPRRKLTPQELGPSYSSDELRAPNYAEMRGSETTFSRFDDEPQIWMMDRRFRRRRRRRNRQKDLLSRSHDASQPYAGAEQNTYYDRVKLFDILQNQEEEKTNQV